MERENEERKGNKGKEKEEKNQQKETRRENKERKGKRINFFCTVGFFFFFGIHTSRSCLISSPKPPISA